MVNTKRRQYLKALGAVSIVGLSAGCTGDGGSGSGNTDVPEDSTASLGGFRLLISDQPVAIGDFDSLEVSFDEARVFRADGDTDELEESATESPAPTESAVGTANSTRTAEPANATVTSTETANGTTTTVNATSTVGANGTTTGTETDTGDQRGFREIDLDGATVDLTRVVGDKALSVFDGELPEGRYAKIELVASDVEGIVDGAAVDVLIPSGKLQIVKPFEVVAGETLSFVFDINVVEKGQTGDYNLLPVVAKSGVSGTDVDVEEIDQDGSEEEADS